LSEGAGAVLLTRDNGRFEIEAIHGGGYFASRRDARSLLEQIVKCVATPETDVVVTSANGTFVDILEKESLSAGRIESLLYSPKPALGESVGASALWQVAAATCILESNAVPAAPQKGPFAQVAILSCGLNQQAAGLRLGRSVG
jgi:3-oxoacyl-(acyl-carrier-protein) synthase